MLDGLEIKRDKRALRFLSIVIKKEEQQEGTRNNYLIDFDEDENLAINKANKFEQSLAYAKEAVSLDLKDGYSWCKFYEYLYLNKLRYSW